MATGEFSYFHAFSRTLGWVSEHELALLRTKRIAIAGMGGVGGSHLLTLSRLGIGAFNISDFDRFELANFNRQAGATMSNLGRAKVEALADMAREINPQVNLRLFPEGVKPENLDRFIEDVDLYVDGLDFFAVDIRRRLFDACLENNIPVVTAAPLGMGTALLNFLPGHMAPDEYFGWDGKPEDEQLVRFLVGLSPAMLQMGYLVDPSRVDLPAHRGPSTPMGCELCAGLAATQVLKILLRRGKVTIVPRGLHFDAYRNRLARTWRPLGHRNPIQRLTVAVARRKFAAELSRQKAAVNLAQPRTRMEEIVDLARWAPSGDNAQPWRFVIEGEDRITVHAEDEAGHDVYDFNRGQPSFLSFGFLLESLRLAATRFGLEMDWSLEASEGHKHRFGLVFKPNQEIQQDRLAGFLVSRSVDRRPYRAEPLAEREKRALESAIGNEFEVVFAESLPERWRCARVNALATQIRLSIPEAFPVHQRILDWGNRFSSRGVPAAAVGVDPGTRKLMQWAMASWTRVDFMNKYLAGTLIPQIELDLFPGLRCAAHFHITCSEQLPGKPERSVLLRAGIALQRFWLTAERLGLVLQPSLAPLAFSSYARHGEAFSKAQAMRKKAERLEKEVRKMVAPADPDGVLFFGRIGKPLTPISSRSVRLGLDELILRRGASRA